MNLTEIWLVLMSTTTPVLPGAWLLRFVLPVMWAVVLAGSVCALGPGLPQRWRWVLSLLIAAWALLPGQVSVTYWLALAFQMPSLMTGLICAVWLGTGLTGWKPPGASQLGLDLVGLIGIALGWLLMLDTLAFLPWSIYTWGFSVASLVVVSALAALLCAVKGNGAGLALTALVLAAFVVTRLPTGNLWDALIDPWLWVALQVGWLRKFMRKIP